MTTAYLSESNIDRRTGTTPKTKPQQVNGPCPQLPGTILRIFLPAGTTINLLNLLEIASPSGVCLIVRIPALAGNGNNTGVSALDTIAKAVQDAGGSIELVPQD